MTISAPGNSAIAAAIQKDTRARGDSFANVTSITKKPTTTPTIKALSRMRFPMMFKLFQHKGVHIASSNDSTSAACLYGW